jgi:hypothetical protein
MQQGHHSGWFETSTIAATVAWVIAFWLVAYRRTRTGSSVDAGP